MNEVLIFSNKFSPTQGPVASVCMPGVDVIRYNWSNGCDDYENDGSLADALMLNLRHSRILPEEHPLLRL